MELFTLGERLMIYRKRAGLSKKEIAQMLEIKVSTYSNYENDIVEPDADTIVELSLILDVSINNLFSGFGIEDKKDSLSLLTEVSPTKLQQLMDRNLV